jgi:6-phosphogluconolactonase
LKGIDMNSLKQILQVLSVLALAPAYAGAQSFTYAANFYSSNVSAYSINPATGALTAVPGSPFATGMNPWHVVGDPTGRFAYVANANSNNVSAFTIDAATGALSAIPGSPFAAGSYPKSLAVDPTGRFAYVANANSNNVSAFTIDAATGALTAVPGSPFAAGSSTFSVAVDPTGRFVYVANAASNNVSAFTINSLTGALSAVPGSPFAVGFIPYCVAVDPTGKFAYVANAVSNNVSAFTINPSTGALSAVPGSPFTAGTDPFSIVVDPTGIFAYVANNDSANISVYTINPATGALSAVPGSPFATGARFAHAIAVDPTGKFAYVAADLSDTGGRGSVLAYTIDRATGALSAVPGSPSVAGLWTFSISVIGVSDHTPPTTIPTASPDSNSDGWNNSDVTVNLSATDNPGGSGVELIQFALAGAQNTGWRSVTGNMALLTISAEGTTVLSYFATDRAGIQEAVKTLTIRIDKTPPVISGFPAPGCTIWPPNHKLVQVATVTAIDALSRLAPGSFTVIGTSNDPSNGQIAITGGPDQFLVQLGADRNVTYTLTATARDLAGNTLTKRAICTVPHDLGK